MTRYALLVLPLSWLLPRPFVRGAEPPRAVHFETHVRPILKAHCFECHGEGKRLRGGFDARLRHTLVEGGDNGPAIAVGKPAESLLIARLRSGEMPPGKKKLAKQDIDVIEQWIAAGATT